MTRRIALIEIETHHEVLRNVMYLLKNSAFQMLCFTNTFNFQQLYEDDINEKVSFILQNDMEDTNSFLSRSFNLIDECDLVLFTSLAKPYPILKNRKFSTPSLLLIHHANKYLSRKRKYCFSNLKNTILSLRFVVNDQRKISQTLKQFNGFVVPTKAIYQHIHNRKNKYQSDKIIGDACLGIPMREPILHKRKVVVIGIPGAISPSDRDYGMVLDAIFKLIENGMKRKIKLKLLGNAGSKVGKKTIKKIKKSASIYLKIQSFDSYLDQQDYDREITDCDFIICPIKSRSCIDGILENNGRSHISGSVTDALNFGIPAIVPSFYPTEEVLFHTYTEIDKLSEEIEKMITKENYNHWKTRYLIKAEKIKAKKSKNFLEMLTSIIHTLD